MTSTMMQFSEANDKYLNTMLNFGNSGGIETLKNFNLALRDLQATAGEIVATTYNAELISGAATASRAITGFVNQVEGMFRDSHARMVLIEEAIGRHPTGPRTRDAK